MYQLLEKEVALHYLFIGDYSLNSVNQLIFVMAKRGVLFEVRTEFLILIRASASKG
jgi:hypothetical protein